MKIIENYESSERSWYFLLCTYSYRKESMHIRIFIKYPSKNKWLNIYNNIRYRKFTVINNQSYLIDLMTKVSEYLPTY